MSAVTQRAYRPAAVGPGGRARTAAEICFETIARGSRSFALASRVLPPRAREAAAVVYTWCRRADDAVDLAPDAHESAEALRRLRAELADAYAGRPAPDLPTAAFAEVVRRCAIPARYPEELLAGMEMDLAGCRYASMDDLLLYCFRAAGAVGLMMSHVVGVSDPRALRNAAHLGIAMQLTNVCRDVLEDWDRGRLYLPRALLERHGVRDLGARLGGPLPREAGPGIARALRELLEVADGYYRSGDAGLAALHWRAALSIRTARLVYADIGRVLERRGHDPFAGRAVVSGPRKLWLLSAAALRAAGDVPRRARLRFAPAPLLEVKGHELVRL